MRPCAPCPEHAHCELYRIDNLYNAVYILLVIDIAQTDEFSKWLKRLKDSVARARVLVRIQRLSLTGNLGDAKSVGDGVFEMRIDHGPGYRIYCARRGSELILLLAGGDKSSQQRDIAKAKKLNQEYE